MFSKILEVVKVLLWPILFGIGQVFICGAFMLVYMVQNSDVNWNDVSSNAILLNYMNNQTLFIVGMECFIFIPLFCFIYKKYRVERVPISTKRIALLCVASFLLSFILNFLIIMGKHFLQIEMVLSPITITIIVATGILGPILEELLFRGIVYGRLSIVFHEKVAFYLSVVIFALFHTGGIFQIVFAFLIGYFLTFVYKKYHNIQLSMFLHIIVNITSILLSPWIFSLF